MAQETHGGGSLSDRDLRLLSAYLDDELSGAERAQLQARLGEDPILQAELDSLRQVVTLVQSLPEVRPPRNFTLDPAQYGRPAPGSRWLALATPLIAAGAALLVVAVCAGALMLGAGSRQLAAPLAGSAPKEEVAMEAPAVEEEAVEEEVETLSEGEVAEEPMAQEAPAEAPAPVEEAEGAAVPPSEWIELEEEGAGRGGAGEAASEAAEFEEGAVEAEAPEPPTGDVLAGEESEADAATSEVAGTPEVPPGIGGAEVEDESLVLPSATAVGELLPDREPTRAAERSYGTSATEEVPVETPFAALVPAPHEPTPAPAVRSPFILGVVLSVAAILGLFLLGSGLIIAVAARRR